MSRLISNVTQDATDDYIGRQFWSRCRCSRLHRREYQQIYRQKSSDSVELTNGTYTQSHVTPRGESSTNMSSKSDARSSDVSAIPLQWSSLVISKVNTIERRILCIISYVLFIFGFIILLNHNGTDSPVRKWKSLITSDHKSLDLQMQRLANFNVLKGEQECYWYVFTLKIYALLEICRWTYCS